MAADKLNSQGKNAFFKYLFKGDMALIIGVISIFIVLIIPVPPFIIDLLVTTNISLVLLLLLVSLHIKGALDLSSFPSILLFMTLFRLALNVASTRQILLQGYGGKVIGAFGDFVVGGNMLVGLVVFLIIVVIQFIVITKGATRIGEVAARFTLDAMPGKQMSIDADLNAGLITEKEARERREKLSREAEFYGAMDGAGKFVSGDAVAGIIIVLINIIGGIVMGMRSGMSVSEAMQHYTLLTVGDGLVSQIPSFIIATASAVIVTKTSATGENLGTDVTGQLFSQPNAIAFAGGILTLFSIVPGLPKIPFLVLAGFFWMMFFVLRRSSKETELAEALVKETEGMAREPKKEESVEGMLRVDRMELEVGYKLVPLVDPNKNGGILERINTLRMQIAKDMGMIVPPIRVRDNLQLETNKYVVKIRGQEIAHGELLTGSYLAIDSGAVTQKVNGIETLDPAYGLPALWITDAVKEDAEALGYTVVDPASVMITHLTEIIKTHAYEILCREDVQKLLETVKKDYPTIVEELAPNIISLGSIQEILKNLLKEQVPIRDLSSILETIADYAPATKDIEQLTEYVRQRLSRTICKRYQNTEGKIGVISFDPHLEQTIANAIHKTEKGNLLALDPNMAHKVIDKLAEIVRGSLTSGYEVVLLTSSSVRSHVRRLIENALPQLAVLSYKEISPGVMIDSVGVVKL
ncbi:putative flagellar export pore protein [Candidatus Kuenenia stuttgartiensis]|uniref:Flagellar biosynthesis protein FlhA n=1 Tax=Kuenenia stuttgartiensis TaxID=174633 RepID=Q1Q6S4_KUEST|nr:flagellar biosynthesis protein FlhA [Candidatus Kuenenia stuttgartiensis]MBZ0193114.1 flagellar biosynthesis protein FlhA [Candidatus Kuenenia stuttgartiensis]MCL4727267.1 flagellar biosynthesis protein FlhA [Candidatus Kuenenia stuttgartiensis]QII12906.1 putative flagellar export pore protein [Candidatus Kuenenia stuttgartiensis]CAJ73284.1 strong similarity to flagellar biosynthesis protein FlhA [Candidatus Kuenenia stuttgartiensis]